MKKTIQSIAKEVQDQLEVKTRTDGTRYICQKDPAVEWITELCHAAHGDALPDDAHYDVISETIDALAELDADADEDDARERLDEIEAPCYTYDLTKWLGSRNSNIDYLTQALEESAPKDGFNALTYAYGIWQREISDRVLSAVIARLDE